MKKILVVGDSMEDSRIDCSVTRLCPEGPLPIYDVENVTAYAGGAANVALNVLRMGGQVTLLTALPHRSALDEIFDGSELPVKYAPAQKLTKKTRLFTPDGVLRTRMDADYVLSAQESEAMLEEFKSAVADHDVVVFSDYGKGALRYVDQMLEFCVGRCTLVDPKGPRWGRYADATIIKANAPECDAMQQALVDLAYSLGVRAIVRTLGAAGSTVHYGTGVVEQVAPMRVRAIDPTGAGDSYLAAMAVALAQGHPLEYACQRGSVAGALATTHVGTAVITAEEIDACMKTSLTTTNV